MGNCDTSLRLWGSREVEPLILQIGVELEIFRDGL